MAASVAAAVWVLTRGFTLWYGDAEAHLETARRIADSRTPGYDQIGTVWLPLPHVLMLPFAADDWLWRTGVAGVIPTAACCVLAVLLLYATLRRALDSAAAAAAAAGTFLLNPNLLYLGGIPMTEAVWFAALLGALCCLDRVEDGGSVAAVLGCSLSALAATLTRYESWLLLPFLALAIWLRGGGRRWLLAILFCAIAGLGPLWCFAHNAWYYGDALEFYRGPWSPRAIYLRGHVGKDPFPAEQHLAVAWLYFRTVVRHVNGLPLALAGCLGCLAALRSRMAMAVPLLAVPALFHLWTMYSGSTEIFVPQLWPHSYYNTRYGLEALPLLACGAGALVARMPRRAAWPASVACVVAAVLPWIAPARPESWLCWKESRVNSDARRAWTRQASEFMKSSYHGGGILCNFGDQSAIFREAGIPLKETLHDGNQPQYDSVMARPDLFLHEEWAIAMAGDGVESALRRSAGRYTLVKAIAVEGAPLISIYRRN